MASRCAFVTLITSDSYLPGALTLAAALRDIHPTPATEPEVDFQTACLVTPETVDVSSVKLLRGAFDVVIGVEIIENDDRRGLELLGKSRCSILGAKAVGAKRFGGLRSGSLRSSNWAIPPFTTFSPRCITTAHQNARGANGASSSNPTQLISNHPLQANSDLLSQGDPISELLLPNFTRSDSLSSPRSSTSIQTFYLSVPSRTCSLWNMSFLLYQTSAGRTFSILE